MFKENSVVEVLSQSQEYEAGSTYDEITETVYSEPNDNNTIVSHCNDTDQESCSTYKLGSVTATCMYLSRN